MMNPEEKRELAMMLAAFEAWCDEWQEYSREQQEDPLDDDTWVMVGSYMPRATGWLPDDYPLQLAISALSPPELAVGAMSGKTPPKFRVARSHLRSLSAVLRQAHLSQDEDLKIRRGAVLTARLDSKKQPSPSGGLGTGSH